METGGDRHSSYDNTNLHSDPTHDCDVAMHVLFKRQAQ
jgi:hypothetical protein